MFLLMFVVVVVVVAWWRGGGGGGGLYEVSKDKQCETDGESWVLEQKVRCAQINLCHNTACVVHTLRS